MDERAAGRLVGDFLSRRDLPEARLAKLSPADWECLAEEAQRFKVGALLHREIKARNLPPELVPVEVRNRFRKEYRDLALCNTRLFIDAATVIKAMADSQLPVMALKGLSLAKSVYGDIALRPMSDVDLLVKEEDLLRAGRILLTLGYTQHYPAWESLLKFYHHLPAFMNKSGTKIELHWTIVTPDSPIRVDVAGLWERACPIEVDTVAARAFSTADQFLHLCLHACFHLETGLDLIPLCDLAGLMNRKIDWQIVLERAARWGGTKCVYLMLLLVRELLGAAPPDAILAEMKPDDYRAGFLDQALDQIFKVSASSQVLGIRVGKLSQLAKARGIKGKLVTLLAVAFPSREYLASIYPVSVSSPKIFLCYGFRLGRLIARYTPVLARLFRRDPAVIEAVHREHRVSAVCNWVYS